MPNKISQEEIDNPRRSTLTRIQRRHDAVIPPRCEVCKKVIEKETYYLKRNNYYLYHEECVKAE